MTSRLKQGWISTALERYSSFVRDFDVLSHYNIESATGGPCFGAIKPNLLEDLRKGRLIDLDELLLTLELSLRGMTDTTNL